MVTHKKTIKKKTVKHASSKKPAVKKKTTVKKVTKKTSKNKSEANKSTHDTLYMAISKPIMVRKLVLESARDMVQFLQLFEKFKSVREQRSQATQKLKQELKALSNLINKLKQSLPKTSIHARNEARQDLIEEIKPEKVSKKSLKQNNSKIPEPEPFAPEIEIDDIEMLERELREIEDKLNFL